MLRSVRPQQMRGLWPHRSRCLRGLLSDDDAVIGAAGPQERAKSQSGMPMTEHRARPSRPLGRVRNRQVPRKRGRARAGRAPGAPAKQDRGRGSPAFSHVAVARGRRDRATRLDGEATAGNRALKVGVLEIGGNDRAGRKEAVAPRQKSPR